MVFLHQFSELWHVNNKFSLQTIQNVFFFLSILYIDIGWMKWEHMHEWLPAEISYLMISFFSGFAVVCHIAYVHFIPWHLLGLWHFHFSLCHCVHCALSPTIRRAYHHYFITQHFYKHTMETLTLTEINLRKYWDACNDYVVFFLFSSFIFLLR